LVYGKRICKDLFYKETGQINYHLKQNEPKILPHMQLVHSACISTGQVSVLQYIVAGATMILFSLQRDRLFLELSFFLVLHNSLTFKRNWQPITGLKHRNDGFESRRKN